VDVSEYGAEEDSWVKTEKVTGRWRQLVNENFVIHVIHQ
jgi:hypothetical protein